MAFYFEKQVKGYHRLSRNEKCKFDDVFDDDDYADNDADDTQFSIRFYAIKLYVCIQRH